MSRTACQVPRQVPVTLERPVLGVYGTSVSRTLQPASAQRLRAELGWSPAEEFEAGVAELAGARVRTP